MMNKHLIIFYATQIQKVKAVKIECNFIQISHVIIGTVYTCITTNNITISSPEEAVITSVTGTHLSGKTNDDVLSFHADNKAIKYLPKGLEFFFKNLKAITSRSGQINQIYQSDLKPFPLFEFLDVGYNAIEILEDNLFNNHVNMSVVYFPNNKIFHVGKNVFNNMKKISWLSFSSNPCISMGVSGNSTGAQIIVESLKTKCYDSVFGNFSQNLSNLETQSKSLTFETFPIWQENLENLENEFKSSQFSYLLSIKSRFEILNAITIDDFTTQGSSTTSTTTSTQKPVTTTTTSIAVTSTSEQPDDCMASNFEDLENNLSQLFNESLSQTEHNLKNSFSESCTDVNYQTLNLMRDEFRKVNEKLTEHLSEVRTEMIRNDVQQAAILNKIANLEVEMANVKDKLGQILESVTRGN